MTAHDVSGLNHDGLQSDNLCAVIDRAYKKIASIQKFLIRYSTASLAEETQRYSQTRNRDSS